MICHKRKKSSFVDACFHFMIGFNAIKCFTWKFGILLIYEARVQKSE